MTAPPQNLEAEENVLGSILTSPAALEACAEVLHPSDFYKPSHGLIFRTALELSERGEPVDALTLADALESAQNIKDAGGRMRLLELGSMVPATANAAHHARIVRDQAAYRSLIAAGSKIRGLGEDRPGDVDSLMAQAEDILSRAVDPTITTQFTPLADELAEIEAAIIDASSTGKVRYGMRTGFVDLDRMTLGFHPGQLILVAARPAMGKSALAQNISENVADSGKAAAFLSLEMSKRELMLRSLARSSNISSLKLRAGVLDEHELAKFREAKSAVERRRSTLFVEDKTDVTPTTLRAEIRRLHRRHSLGVVVVDYLQLMLPSRTTDDNQNQMIGAVSRSLKLLARDLNIPIIALSQLNRNLENRKGDKRPQLSDLRDSGSLEQDADVVLFIYRDDYYNPDSDSKGVAEIIAAKNRMGPTGTVKLAFNARATRFNNLAQGVTE